MLPENLPRIEEVHDIAEEEKVCGCGSMLSRIGEEVTEELDIVPRQCRVIRHIRPKYACRQCEGVESDKGAIQIAPVPVQLLPLLAGVAVKSRWETVAQRLMKPLTWIASAVGLLVILLIVVTDLNKILSVDWRTITAALILVGTALAMGWLLGGPGPLSRRVLAVTTSARNVAVQ